MKRIQSMSIVGSLLVAMSSNLLAEEAVAPVAAEKKAEQKTSAATSSTLPLGATLPKNMMRARVFGHGNVGSDKTYLSDTNTYVKSPADRSTIVSAVALEYGILDSLSAQVVAPFVLRNEVTLNDKTTAAKTGLSDMEAGAIYNFLNDGTWVLSAGLGMRFPTGAYADTAQAADMTGLGAYDLGLRLNADYQVANELWLSLQDQEQVQVSSVEHKASKTHLDKSGLSRKAFAQVSYGLKNLSNYTKAFNVKGRYAYDYNSAVKVRESKKVVTEASSKQAAGFGLGIEGFEYGIPVALDAMYFVPVTATNTTVSQELQLTLSAYVQI